MTCRPETWELTTRMAFYLLPMSLAYCRLVPLNVSRREIQQVYEDEVRLKHSSRFSPQSQEDGGDGSTGDVPELAGWSFEALS